MGRRADGEGSIGKRADGTHYGSVQFEGKRRWVYGATRKEVVEKLKALRKELEEGINPDGKGITVEAFLNRWLEDIVKQRNKPRTYASYKQIVTDYIIPSIGKVSLASLRPDKVQALINTLTKGGKAPRTIRNVRAVLRRALNQAMAWRYVSYNAAAVVDTPRVEKFEITPLSKDEARRFMETIKGHKREALYLMALLLGLREGELLGLLISNVDFAAGTVTIDGTLQWQNGKLVREKPKTKASSRVLPLPTSLIPLLKEHIAKQQKKFPFNRYLFASAAGTPINNTNLVRQFKELLSRPRFASFGSTT